jgi:cytochrome c biogenesis protein CcdA/glutaredoxin
MRKVWVVLVLALVGMLVALALPSIGWGMVWAQQAVFQGGADLPALSGVAESEPDEPVVCFYLFYSQTCPHCHEIMENYLPTVYEKYGDQVEYQYFDIYDNTDLYITMLALEQKFGMPEEDQGYVPVLFIGDKALMGGNQIPDELEGYIDEYLAQGGAECPSLEDLPEVILPTAEPAVQILVIFDPNHADFERLNALIVSLGQEHSSGLQAFALDVTGEESADIAAQINGALGISVPEPGIPEVLIGRQMLVGVDEIESQLPGLVETYLSEGGLNLPSLEELLASGPAATITPEPTATGPEPPATEPAQKPIYLAYFEKAGCQECARTTYDLELVKEQYPQLIVESFHMEDEESTLLNECLSDKNGVPEEKRLSTPMIFVGEDVLIGEEATLKNLLAVVGKYDPTGAERIWGDCDTTQSEQRIIERFQSFGLLTVLGAGLIDGLNPCAFATLVFFISYLAFTGRRGRDILLVGLAFALGVFVTYLLVGVGLLKIVQSLGFFTTLGRWVYLLTALLCVILAILTFRDFFKARKGQVSEMALKLPLSLRRRINKVIRENAQTRAFVAMAFVTGFAVSLIELACTGQVYVPTIVYVMSQPELAAQAFFYLVLYCLMFILPLIVVFALSYLGTTSEQLAQFVNRHTSTIKLITGLVFVGLALWMIWSTAPLFGVEGPWIWAFMAGVVAVIALGVLLAQILDKRASPKPSPRRRRSRA